MLDERADTGLILPDEESEDLQRGGLRILQKKHGFRFGLDAVLLADFARIRPDACVTDFGTGNGILPLLLYGRGKGTSFDAFEMQADMADMTRRSMLLNGLSDTVRVHTARVEDAPDILAPCSQDAIVCNPPYAPPGTSRKNPSEELSSARHQAGEGIGEWFHASYVLLKGHGKLYMIYPAPRMLELMQSLQEHHLEPKAFRLVYPRADQPANLVLIQAVKDARPTLDPQPPLIVHEADGSMTPELRRIYGQEDRV